ncbi:MAG: hypothetical protein HYS57_01335 [Parcubacteria group bacterium]|nr:hypothetical protein [Parcubacteria group bacterium]
MADTLWPFGANPRTTKNYFAVVLGIYTLIVMAAGLVDFYKLGPYEWIPGWLLRIYTLLLWPYVGLKEWARFRNISLDDGWGQLFPWAWLFYIFHMIVVMFFTKNLHQIQPDVFWVFGQSWLSYGISLIFKIEKEARRERMLKGLTPFDKSELQNGQRKS